MTPENLNISCYTTSLLLKYARKHSLPDITAGLPVAPEHLNNPREWTTSPIWTELAKNLENALGNRPGVLADAAQEILEKEVGAFFPLFLKIAPLKILFGHLSRYTQQYSNKNLVISVEIVSKYEINVSFRPIDATQYSKQMCEFNRGWAGALANLRGYTSGEITESRCSLTSGGIHPCVYNIKWNHENKILHFIKFFFVYPLRRYQSVINHMENNHRELQKQYREILSIRDFYSHIMSSMGEAVIWLNADAHVDFTNNAFCRLIGKSDAEAGGRLFADFLADTTSTELFSATCTDSRNKPGFPHESEFVFAGTSDGPRHGQTTIIWVTSEHFAPGYVISIRDITEKRKIERQLSTAEDRYRSLYENSPALIVAVNLDGRFIYANPAMTEQTGYKEDELKTIHFKELIAPQADFDVDRLLKNLLAHPTRLQEVHFKTKHGIWKCIALNTYHIHDSDGTLAGIAGIGIDVTETKRLNEQIIKSQRMDLLGQLAGGMAHDFGNILTSINGFSKLISGKSTDEKIVSYAESIGRSGVRAHDLIKNLLAFSRGDARRSVVFDVKSIAQEVKEMMFGAISKSIELLGDFPDEPVFIMGDPGNIHQCILNLCVNARDAIGKESGTITMKVKKGGAENRLVQVQVLDTGCGIPPDIIEKIFDPFFSTKEKKEGTGLGLSVVYGIMKSHNGNIHVESHPGEGAEFTLEFPAAEPPLLK